MSTDTQTTPRDLSPDDQGALLRMVQQGRPAAEIARVFGVSVADVESVAASVGSTLQPATDPAT
jgi:DNA-directed RNA polymerase specialized sigma24 family protein